MQGSAINLRGQWVCSLGGLKRKNYYLVIIYPKSRSKQNKSDKHGKKRIHKKHVERTKTRSPNCVLESLIRKTRQRRQQTTIQMTFLVAGNLRRCWSFLQWFLKSVITTCGCTQGIFNNSSGGSWFSQRGLQHSHVTPWGPVCLDKTVVYTSQRFKHNFFPQVSIDTETKSVKFRVVPKRCEGLIGPYCDSNVFC